MRYALFVALSLSAFLVYGQSTQLKLASDVWPPFTDVADKHAFALDLVKEALARTHVQAHTDILDFKEVIPEIRKGTFDGSAALWYSPERAEFLLYSEPYLENRLILVGKKGSDVSAASLSELKGKRIAVVGSYAYGELLDDATNMELVKGVSDQQNLERLLKGEAEYMLVDALLIEYLLANQSKEAAQYLQIGTNTLIKLPLYFVIRKDIPHAGSIIEKFNEEIKRMIADGTYNQILQINWIATDMDGDGQPELVLGGDKAGTEPPMNSYMVMTKNGQAPVGSGSYYIEGSLYKDWDHVPQKYKVPQGAVPNAEKSGFGPVFSF